MKPSYEKLPVGPDRSFQVKHFTVPYFDSPFHFHPEYELTYIVRGSGQRFVGDNVSTFSAGDLVLLGPDLPHFWKSSSEYYEENSALQCEAVVVHFSQLLATSIFNVLPEFESIKALIAPATSGLFFDIKKHSEISTLMLTLHNNLPSDQLINFFQLLNLLTQVPTPTRLAGTSFQLSADSAENERMRRILEYTMLHFHETITLKEIAAVAHLSEAAFCRYFKKRCSKSYFSYLNELRVSHAKQLIGASWMSIGQVALESGYSNLSHFHRQFHRQTGVSPLRYRQHYQNTSV